MIDQVEQEIRILRSIFWSDRDPDGRAFAPLADAYCRAGQFRQAVELLMDGRKRHPRFATGHAVAARVFLEKGLMEEGELAARRVLELDEENVMALRLLSEALEARGAKGEAASVRARLEVLEPAGDGEVEEEPTDVAAPAPDEAEAAEDKVMDVAAQASEEPVAAVEEEVVDVAAPTLEEPEAAVEEEVVDVAAPTLEEPEAAVEEEVVDVAAPTLE
ncbi:MAG: hypothetical protein LJF06_03840, partial [Gemmatimonadetes bacterium]|nr:hypothetical protein [Gemmatimonadota bacterium]